MNMKTWMCMLAGATAAALGNAALAGVANDLCANATPVSGPGTHTFNTTGATQDGFPTCNYDFGDGPVPSDDVWFLYTPGTVGQSHIVVTASPELSSVHMSVRTACSGGQELVCNTDAGLFTEGFTFLTSSAQSYLIRLGGYSSFGYAGAGSFTITEMGPPENDTCAGATEIGPGTYPWSITAAAEDGPAASCGNGTEQQDVWYHYYASTTGNAVVTTGSSGENRNFDSTITVFNACNGSEIACGSIFTGRHWAGFPIVSGGEYWVRLARPAGSGGLCCGYQLQFTINEFASGSIPTNNTAATATNLTAPGSYSFNNTGVITTDAKDTCSPYGAAYAAVWFKYTPTQTGLLRFRASTGPNQTTVADVYASPSSTSPIACGWFNYFDSPFGITSITQNVPVYIRVFCWVSGGNNNFHRAGTLVLEEGAAAPNDTCGSPATAVLGGNSYNTNIATLSSGINDGSCSFATFPDLWYAFTPSQTGSYGFDTCSDVTGYEDSNLSIYAACNGAPLACNDNLDYVYFPDSCRFGSWSWNQSAFSYTLTGGTTYLVRVGNRNNAAGQLNIAFIPPACPADFNGDNTRDVADLFAYINAWLAKTANADFNNSGGVDVADLFAYINAWLAGC